MSFWKADLTTRDGAENAAANGGLTCLIVAGLAAVGFAWWAGSVGITRDFLLVIVVPGIVLFLVAGLRLRKGRGAYWGVALVLFLALETLTRAIILLLTALPGNSLGRAIGTASLGAFVVNLVVLVPVVNGVRGAWALRRDSFDEDVAEVFS